ncbi:DUF418 domain-containing protein [Streptomyces benahoarensis]|uniref:DUF418 domain-containing protein n=1 Tax=Streptomyces benahoarensis TaxID=2595054 RepID=A0A553ZRQ5_9ACTN|nr:DUF418 domain-containing protein [Streptomyces benahoarensis]TSB44132.1 DUF418 domain-containing protein [Streptomyces benahoarensis]
MHQTPVPAEVPAPQSAMYPAAAARARGVGRLVGVDLARGLAVFGMFAAHVGPDPSEGGITGFLMELSHGRASALFALLAGFSVILMTGRRTPKTGREGRQAVAKVLIRAAILLVLGTLLTKTGTPIEVILAFYGLYFVLVLPLYRLGAGRLAAIAVGTALVLPQVRFMVEWAIESGGPGVGSWAAGMGGPGAVLVDLLFTGSYPALSWLPFVIAGMAVARLDLASTAVRLRLALTGAAVAVLGYGGSWLALHLVPGAAGGLAEAYGSGGESGTGTGSVMSAWWSDIAGDPTTDTPAWLLTASPHSETTLSILGNTGVALLVLIACITACDRLVSFRRLARPVIAVGTMSLTVYVFHIVAINLLGMEELPGEPLLLLIVFIVVSALFAVSWSRHFSRGPLESLLNSATRIARHVK